MVKKGKTKRKRKESPAARVFLNTIEDFERAYGPPNVYKTVFTATTPFASFPGTGKLRDLEDEVYGEKPKVKVHHILRGKTVRAKFQRSVRDMLLEDDYQW